MAFEIAPDQMASAAHVVLRLGTYGEGRSLSDGLPASLYEEAIDRLAAAGVPAERAERLKPWFAALTLTSIGTQLSGFEAAAGIDQHFYERERASGLEVTGLETVEEPLAGFDDLSLDAQAAISLRRSVSL